MKKVLFATTALVASAGIAAAEVALKGSAEMGIVGGTGIDVQFHTDIDVTFTLSGETDNGLTFGASIDLDESDGSGSCSLPGGLGNVAATATCNAVGSSAAFASSTQGGESIFLSGNFGTITMGDTDGAFDWAMQEVLVAGGSINDAEEHGGYNGNSGLDGSTNGAAGDGLIMRYDYSFGDFAFAVSAELDSDAGDDDVFGVGVKYSADLGGIDLGVGLGYQQGNANADIWGISVDGSMDNGFGFALNYSDINGADHYGIGLGYETGALAIGVNYGDFQGGNSGFGLAAAYDLGGGAEIQFGYGNTDLAAGGSSDSYSLGVSMSF